MPLAENIAHVQERIASASFRSGRKAEEIALMVVTKTFPPEQIRVAYDAGLRVFGENRLQEFAGKVEALHDLNDAEWHMIGHVQSNKATKAVEIFAHVDSLDSVRLARKLNAAASEIGKRLPVLIEINIAGEKAKNGVAPDSAELLDLLLAAPELSSLEFRGLMAVPPYVEDPGRSRPYFRKMRELFAQINSRKLPAVRMEVLSMGMSRDFDVAIEEGATCVRVGTAIFGARPRA